MATIGVYCGAFVDPIAPDTGGGAPGRSVTQYGNRAAAQRDDDDILVMLEAYFNRHRKH